MKNDYYECMNIYSIVRIEKFDLFSMPKFSIVMVFAWETGTEKSEIINNKK